MRRLFASPLRSVVLVALAALSVLRDCDCGDDPGGLNPKAWDCSVEGARPGADEEACGGGDRYVKGTCAPSRCDSGELGCCPGMFCTSAGTCQVRPSNLEECATDADCSVPGQRCLTRPRVSGTAKTCGFLPVDASGACPEGGQAFAGRCITGVPCGGGCPEGKVCNVELNGSAAGGGYAAGYCEDAPALPSDGGCSEACGVGAMLVFADPDAMLFEQCCAVSCACATLPDLPLGVFGRYSDMQLTAEGILVSGYDATYGDLAFATLSRDDGATLDFTAVDGLPADGVLVANPEGPRGGLAEPGPDVGQYTSLALAGGAPRITYYDADAKDLKLAAFDGASWTTSVVDADGDVGRYGSLVVDASGLAHVTYYAHRVEVGGRATTGVVYARAKTTIPAGPSDWDRVLVDSAVSCEGACAEGSPCVLDADGTPRCATPRTDCASACACDQRCVDVAGAPACRPAMPDELRVPCDGHCVEGSVCVSDDAGGSACATSRDDCASCAEGEACVDGGGAGVCRTATPYPSVVGLPDGLGLFTSLVLDDGVPTLVYYDRLRHQLRGAVASGAGSLEFSAFPLACPAGEDVGQHAALVNTPTGLLIAYQGQDGETLWACQGGDLIACAAAAELVDDGGRTSRVHLVGAYASPAVDSSGAPYIAYADQTDNDLVLAYRKTSAWRLTELATEGAFGGSCRLAIASGRGYVTSYLRERDARDEDTSHLVLTTFDPAALP